MKARLLMCLGIILDNKDKEILKKTNTLECRVSDFPNQRVYLHVFDDIDLLTQRNSCEVKGFHVEVFPKYCEAQDRLRYDIYLDREVIEKLFSSSGNDFESRSHYDWFNFNYYDC